MDDLINMLVLIALVTLSGSITIAMFVGVLYLLSFE